MEDNLERINTIVADGCRREAILQAAGILRTGGLVAFPTETVYGLGADALSKKAAGKIYSAKGRPSDNPLIVHVADVKAVYELAEYVPDKAEMLMEAFWPGPLTIILPKKEVVPDETTGGLNTVALRMPSHPVALDMIKASGLYIAAPSANTSGRPSPTEAAHVAEDMNGKIDMILDGGAVGIGIESTIVDLTGACPTILRPGFITKQMLENIIGFVEIDVALKENESNIRPKAPGMKYTHYAPKGEMTIVEASNTGDMNLRIVEKINELVSEKMKAGCNVAVIATSENADLYKCQNVLVVGERTSGETIAAKLYGTLRKCDDLSVDYIYSEAFHTGELGSAIMNRLLKAAGHRVIKV
ncbi:MAG: threonylcarbamoyl-AMP synthase [Lachnospiraceae bacterium]|nr:threonylcarbamoyl-AMP synthase [Lachnospiraceae bacterium]